MSTTDNDNILAPGLPRIKSVQDAIDECAIRVTRHSRISIIFGALFGLVVVVALIFLICTINKNPLWKVTVEEDGKTTITEPATENLVIILPTLAVIAAFLSGLVRFHLKLMSRWQDYALAFARIKIAENGENGEKVPIQTQAALLAAPFATISHSPDVEFSTLVERLEQLTKK